MIKSGAPSIGEARPDLPSASSPPSTTRLRSTRPGGRPRPGAVQGASSRVAGAGAESQAAESAGRGSSRDAGWCRARRLPWPLSWPAGRLPRFPFYPARWPLLLAAVAAGLMAVQARLGLAFTLAVPVFPLGQRLVRAGARVRRTGCRSGSRSCGATRGAGSSSDRGSFSGRSACSGSCRSRSCASPARCGGRRMRSLRFSWRASSRASTGRSIPFSGASARPAGHRRERASGRGPRVVLAMASEQPRAGHRGADPRRDGRCAPVRDPQGRPLDRGLRGRAPRGHAARGAARRRRFRSFSPAGSRISRSRCSRDACPSEPGERRLSARFWRQTRAHFRDRLKAAGGQRWPRPQGRFRDAGAR